MLKLLALEPPLRVRVIHLWEHEQLELGRDRPSVFSPGQAHGYYSLIWLARALIGAQCEAAHITMLCSGIHDATSPERAMILGPSMVISQETPHITCRVVDMPSHPLMNVLDQADLVLAEAWNTTGDKIVTYNKGSRFAKSFERVKLDSPSDDRSQFKQRGNYLLVGGLGPVGLHTATYIADRYNARLFLVGRAGLPPRSEWPSILSESEQGNETRRRLEALEQLESKAGAVRVCRADVTDLDSLEAAVVVFRLPFP